MFDALNHGTGWQFHCALYILDAGGADTWRCGENGHRLCGQDLQPVIKQGSVDTCWEKSVPQQMSSKLVSIFDGLQSCKKTKKTKQLLLRPMFANIFIAALTLTAKLRGDDDKP